MKMRITVEDLQQLTDEQKQRLREWWKPQEGDHIAGEWLNENDGIELQCLGIVLNIITEGGILLDTGGSIRWCPDLPLLSIGQMIELLSTFGVGSENDLSMFGDFYNKKYTWDLEHGYSENFLSIRNYAELCDCLWQAVKEIL